MNGIQVPLGARSGRTNWLLAHHDEYGICMRRRQYAHGDPTALGNWQIERNGAGVSIREDLLLGHYLAVDYQFQRHLSRVPNPGPFNRPIRLLVIRQRLDLLIRHSIEQSGNAYRSVY